MKKIIFKLAQSKQTTIPISAAFAVSMVLTFVSAFATALLREAGSYVIGNVALVILVISVIIFAITAVIILYKICTRKI